MGQIEIHNMTHLTYLTYLTYLTFMTGDNFRSMSNS